jgi:hypothetical protein
MLRVVIFCGGVCILVLVFEVVHQKVCQIYVQVFFLYIFEM